MKMHLLEAAAAPGFGIGNWVMIIAMIAVFYFFMIRPQQKKQKEARKFREGLKEGDKIITIGGVHGNVVSVDDSTVVVTIESGAKIRFEKSAVSMDANSQMANQPK